jgi:tetratricopeptide (TPR) repeat protein/predicted Ser/Thr protein kinase
VVCPDPNLIAELGEGVLAPDERVEVEAHLKACEDCRRVVSTLSLPEKIGRFQIASRIGAGAMGAVYCAYDPELDRKVALKVLHAGGDNQRLQAEARAMARLAHPNVVPVLDLGTDRGRMFLAMELVDGVTLRTWNKGRARKEIVRAMMEAGRGLAAAHAAGLTHRDFKPENVLVGRDGRVRVTDFGLARDDGELRQSMEMAGTPAYMAPEQFRGQPAGPATDQFAFCVVLWEALFGEPPFDTTRGLEGLAEATLAGRLRPLPRGERLRGLLLRGLAADPAARFPSMEALLDELGRNPPRKLWIGLMLLVIAVGVGLWPRTPLCTGAESRLLGVWDGPRKQASHNAFTATKLPYAGEAWRRVEILLDDYSREWVAMRTDACEATRKRGDQSEAVMDLRMMCLSQRLQELKAAVDVLTPEKGVEIAAGLPALSVCADVEALKNGLRPPRDTAPVEAVRGEIARARALEESGRYREGLPLAESALSAARATRYPPLEAEALNQLGRLLRFVAPAGAEKVFEDAYFAAESSRHDEIAARAASSLVQILSEQPEREAECRRWEKATRAVLARGGDHWKIEPFLEDGMGTLLANLKQYDEALAHYRRALQTVAEHNAAHIHDHISYLYEEQGKNAEALEESRLSLALSERFYGPEHPTAAFDHLGIGTNLDALGRYQEALVEERRALAIWEKALGPENTHAGDCHTDIGVALSHLGRKEEAVRELKLAIAIGEKLGEADRVKLRREDLAEINSRR